MVKNENLIEKSVAEMTDDVYVRAPLDVRDGIPIFSSTNEYVENYEQISHDHLSVMEKDGTNPFMDEDLWVELENSTAQLVEKYSKPGDMVLDVGVSLGRLLSKFPHLQRYGMDISLGYLKISKSKGINVCYSLVEDMPYREGLFDMVIATDILEHVLDLNLCCAKMLSVLKKGGVFIVRVPNREYLGQYFIPENPYKYVHLRNFDEDSLRMLFERIFDCECIDWAVAGYYLHNSYRLKYRLPRGEDRLFAWLDRLKRHWPSAYKKLVPKITIPLGISVVVRKK
jgi:SAM-dependent methyltransferase